MTIDRDHALELVLLETAPPVRFLMWVATLVSVVVLVGPACVAVAVTMIMSTILAFSLVSSVMVDITIASVLAMLIELASELIGVVVAVPILTISRALEGCLHIRVEIRIEIINVIVEVLAMVRWNIFPRLSQIIDSRIPNVLVVVPLGPLDTLLGFRVLIRIHLKSHWFLRPK